MRSEKIQNIQALRGIAVLLVVFSHMLIAEEKYARFENILTELLMIGVSGVDLFFLISGFVMVAVTRRSFQSRVDILQFLYRRVTRIYPLYWFYSGLILCVYIVQPTLVNSSQGNQVNILASFLLIPQNLPPLLGVGWTLIHEMYFYFGFAVLLLLPKENFLIGLIGWGSIVALGNYYFPIGQSVFTNYYFHPLTIEFIGGSLIACLYFSRSIIGNARFFALLAFVTWVGGHFVFQTLSAEVVQGGWARVLVYGLPSALALYASLLYEKNHGAIMPGWICRVGDASYSIYLSHVMVLSVIGRFWSLFAAKGYWDNILLLLAMIIAVIAAGLSSFHFIERVILKQTRKFENRFF